ncbi:Uncharacterised protein [Lysinibacillus capsici]|uniref:Uncharacterized protein n=1 Tax=Lysinibacillus capsici TaxID=2115968 RepID=A0A2X1BWR8_9BACI|nr:Uncharacterised protein [Lysinibacillus capsici]
MVNEQILQTVVVQRVQSLLSNVTEDMLEEEIEQHLHIPYLQKILSKEDAVTRVYKGHVLLYLKKINYFILVIFQKDPIESLGKQH